MDFCTSSLLVGITWNKDNSCLNCTLAKVILLSKKINTVTPRELFTIMTAWFIPYEPLVLQATANTFIKKFEKDYFIGHASAPRHGSWAAVFTACLMDEVMDSRLNTRQIISRNTSEDS